MIYEDLRKDAKIKAAIKHLAERFGENNFRIKDHWEGDLLAIGLTDNDERYLVYISAYCDNGYFVSLENLRTVGDLPYEPAGDFDDVNLKELAQIFAKHLQL